MYNSENDYVLLFNHFNMTKEMVKKPTKRLIKNLISIMLLNILNGFKDTNKRSLISYFKIVVKFHYLFTFRFRFSLFQRLYFKFWLIKIIGSIK